MVTRRVTLRKRSAAATLVTKLNKKVLKLHKELKNFQLNRLQQLEALRDKVRDLEKSASSSGAPQPLRASAAFASEGSRQGKRVIRVAARQSGVKGVQWCARDHVWKVRRRESSKLKEKQFPVRRYMESSGKDYEEACADALRDAIAFQEEGLVKGGVIKAPAASHQSGIRGVCWAGGRWQVRIGGKRITCGSFRPQDDTPEAIERARLAAVECRRRVELEHFQILINNIFPPKDFSEESIEAARLMAIQELKDVKRLHNHPETPS